jgi:hypothetical protein
MPPHSGLWLTQIRLNSSQTLLSGRELFSLPEIKALPSNPGSIEKQLVRVHFYAGSYSFWGVAVDFETGDFLGYSRNRITDPEGRWGLVPYQRLLGIRIPIKIDGVMTRIPLERDQHFHPMSLEEALRWE